MYIFTYLFVFFAFLDEVELPRAHVMSKQVVLVILGSLGSCIKWQNTWNDFPWVEWVQATSKGPS